MENEKYITFEQTVLKTDCEFYRQKMVVYHTENGEMLLHLGMVESAENAFKRAIAFEEYSLNTLAKLLISDATIEFLYHEKVAEKNAN